MILSRADAEHHIAVLRGHIDEAFDVILHPETLPSGRRKAMRRIERRIGQISELVEKIGKPL